MTSLIQQSRRKDSFKISDLYIGYFQVILAYCRGLYRKKTHSTAYTQNQSPVRLVNMDLWGWTFRHIFNMDDLASLMFRFTLKICVSSLITFDTNLNICVYFSLVCTSLFNKKKLTQHVRANLTQQRMLCVPQMTFLFF